MKDEEEIIVVITIGIVMMIHFKIDSPLYISIYLSNAYIYIYTHIPLLLKRKKNDGKLKMQLEI